MNIGGFDCHDHCTYSRYFSNDLHTRKLRCEFTAPRGKRLDDDDVRWGDSPAQQPTYECGTHVAATNDGDRRVVPHDAKATERRRSDWRRRVAPNQ